MGTVRARMAFTDPLWNVAIGHGSPVRTRPGLVNDDLPDADFREFLSGFADRMVAVTEGDIYVVMASREWPTISSDLRPIPAGAQHESTSPASNLIRVPARTLVLRLESLQT